MKERFQKVPIRSLQGASKSPWRLLCQGVTVNSSAGTRKGDRDEKIDFATCVFGYFPSDGYP